MEIDEIEEGYFYHIYNRGNNSEKIFFSEENYAYFLKLLTKYIFPDLSAVLYFSPSVSVIHPEKKAFTP